MFHICTSNWCRHILPQPFAIFMANFSHIWPICVGCRHSRPGSVCATGEYLSSSINLQVTHVQFAFIITLRMDLWNPFNTRCCGNL